MTEEKKCPDCGTPLVNYCLECKSAYIEVNKEVKGVMENEEKM